MPKTTACLCFAALLLGLAPAALGHGGMWRGPVGLPPGARVPTGPLPSPVPTPRPGIPTSPTQPGFLPPSPGSIPPGGTSYRPQPVPRRPSKQTGPGLEHWVYWWNLNREKLLDLRALRTERLRSQTGGDSAHFFGEGSKGNTSVDRTTKPREEILRTLLAAAEDKHKDVATGSIIALGKAGDTRALPLLMKLARNRKVDRTVNESAALALGMIGKRRSEVRPFLADLAADPNERTRTRAFAVLGLGFLGDPGAIPVLMSRIRARESSREVPASALLGLGLLADELVVPDLSLQVAGGKNERQKDGTLRSYAAAALGMIRSRAALPALLKTLGDRNRELRRQAVLSIGALARPEDQQITKLLAQVLSSDRDPQTRAFAAVALGEIGAPASADALLYAYRKGDAIVVPYAAIGLALTARNSRDPAVAERIRPFLRSQLLERGNADLKAALAVAVGIAKDRSSVRSLMKIVSSRGTADLRGHAAVALGLIGAEEAIPLLRKALTAQADPDVQREVALALGLLADRKAVRILVDLVKNGKTEFVRGSAATALGRLASPAAAEALRDVLADEKNPVTTRAFVAVALGLVMDPQPVPLLARLGEHFNHRMALEAVAEVLTFL